MLVVYAQAVGATVIQLWVGIFGTETPAAPQFSIDGVVTAPDAPGQMTPIRDLRVGPQGLPINHRGIFRFTVAKPGQRHLVEVRAGQESRQLATNTLPDQVPQALDGSFNILLSSCYFQPEDHNGLLGTIVSQIKVQPHLTLLAGDQIYGDLPLLEDLPDKEPGLSRMLGDKYLRNWGAVQPKVPGLEALMTRAPVVMMPDDHEFWNNYPFPQKQLPNLWHSASRKRWEQAAQALYEDYQLATPAAQAGATRLDVDPLKMLFLDMRCHRDDQFQQMMNPTALAALDTWVQDLLADKAAGKPAIGLLSSGQALFIDPPTKDSKKRDVDAEMGNYAQFSLIEEALTTLAEKGVPVVYVTGDVHWGRVASAEDRRNPTRSLIYEVISSPSRLIRVPFLDTGKEAFNGVKGIFGHRDPWPRHAETEKPPDFFGARSNFALKCEFKQRGDQVAILSFSRAGGGLDFKVSYYGIHPDKSLSQSQTAGPFQLRPI